MAEAARPRIVLIDDDPAVLGLMDELLTSEGYEVLPRREGTVAYELVKQQRPDLVILDIRLGGKADGWKVLEALTRDPATAAIPVLICSAAVDELRAREPGLRRPGLDFLPKPFDLEELLARVETALARGPR